MNESESPRILARVATGAIAWVMTCGVDLIGSGSVSTYEELRGVQVRAGVLDVALVRTGEGFHLPARLPYAGEWRLATAVDRLCLDLHLSRLAPAAA